jgi:hypothetical protein
VWGKSTEEIIEAPLEDHDLNEMVGLKSNTITNPYATVSLISGIVRLGKRRDLHIIGEDEEDE